MPFLLTKDHNHYFKDHGFLELEEMVPPSRLKQVKKELSSSYQPQINFEKSCTLFRDLANKCPAILRLVQNKDTTQLAKEIFEAKEILYGGDLLFWTPLKEMPRIWEGKPLTLESLFSFAPLVGGAITLISGKITENHAPLPHQIGSTVFINPNTILPLDRLGEISELQLLIIAYASKDTVYRPVHSAPNSFYLKHLGYQEGEPLQTTIHNKLL